MISFIRGLMSSKVGLVFAMLFLGLIALAFAAGDVQNLGLSGAGGGATGGAVAEVDGDDVPASELVSRTDQQWRQARQQQPTLDIAAFVAGGGVDSTLDRIVNGLSLQAFAHANGMRVGDRLTEGRIASIAAFQGASGKFDANVFRDILQQERLSEAEFRADIARETLVNQLMAPIVGATQIPVELTMPYANLLLEQRRGEFGLIPAAALPAGAAPTAQELQTYYQRNVARYTVPERRVVQYAVFDRTKVSASAVPTDAEIAAAYNGDRARFAARQTRSFAQVIVADQAGANAIAERVKSGTALGAAAQTAGLEATTLNGIEKSALAGQSSAAVADAAFAAAQGSVVGPVRSPLGWHVLRVEGVTDIAGRSLAQARDELVTELTRTKTDAALADLVANIEDEAGGGASFAEVARQFGLTAVRSAPVITNGANPDAPADTPTVPLTAVLKTAFEAETADDPQVATLPAEGGYVLWDLDSIVPATPRPLAAIREVVIQQLIADRRQRAARTIARQVVAKVDKGITLAQALRETGLDVPPTQTVGGTRAQLTSQQGQLAPPIALMFSMAEKRAKQLEAPNKAGYLIVYLDDIVDGDARRNPEVVNATRGGLARVIGQEYAQQFARAVRVSVGAKTNPEAVAAAKRQISGQAAAQ